MLGSATIPRWILGGHVYVHLLGLQAGDRLCISAGIETRLDELYKLSETRRGNESFNAIRGYFGRLSCLRLEVPLHRLIHPCRACGARGSTLVIHVLHTCDVRICVSIVHLSARTTRTPPADRAWVRRSRSTFLRPQHGKCSMCHDFKAHAALPRVFLRPMWQHSRITAKSGNRSSGEAFSLAFGWVEMTVGAMRAR